MSVDRLMQVLTCVAAIAGGGGGCIAGVMAADPQRRNTVLALPDQIDLGGLVVLTADTLGLTIEFDPTLLRPAGGQAATVSFRGERELTSEELWAFTTQVLATRGFALVRPAGSKVLSLVRLDNAAAMAGMRLEGDAAERSGFVSELVRVRFRPTKEIIDVAKASVGRSATMVPLGESGLILVSDVSTRVDEIKRLIERIDVARESVAIVAIEPRHLPASVLAASVMSVSGKRDTVGGAKTRGEIIVAPDGRTLLLLAPMETHASWKSLIDLLDRQEEVITTEYTTRAFTPKEVADLIEKTVRDAASNSPPAAGAGAGVGGSGGGGGGGGVVMGDRLRLIVNDLTGTLIVTATPSQHERIRELIERLEATPGGSARPLRAFAIRNRPAGDVLTTLSSLISGGALLAVESDTSPLSATPRESSGVQRSIGSERGDQRSPSSGSIMPVVVPPPTAGEPVPLLPPVDRGQRVSGLLSGGAAGAAVLAPGVSLNVDEGTNSILAIAEPRVLAQLEKLIQLIDVRQPQVMLEMTLVSLSEQDAMNLGIELEKVGLFDGAAYQISSLFGLTGGSAGDRTAGDSRGLTSAILNPGDFSVVLRALQTLSKGSTRSVPSVLVSNNETAQLDSVLQQPYVVSNTTSGAGTTTSFGGTQDAGTTISVSPQIAQADQLLLEYSITLSSFVGAPPSNGLPPARQQNTVSSKATIPDGFTVVVGGIDLQSEGKNTSQVPGVGDVPLLGELFKQRDNSEGRSRFYVFIRATVLRDQMLNDLKYISGKSLKAAAVSDGFPSVRPRIVR